MGAISKEGFNSLLREEYRGLWAEMARNAAETFDKLFVEVFVEPKLNRQLLLFEEAIYPPPLKGRTIQLAFWDDLGNLPKTTVPVLVSKKG